MGLSLIIMGFYALFIIGVCIVAGKLLNDQTKDDLAETNDLWAEIKMWDDAED